MDVSAAFHAADIPERKEAMDDVERVIWNGPMDAYPSSWLFGYGNRSVPTPAVVSRSVCVILPCVVVDRSRFEAQHLFGLLIGGTLYAEPLQHRYQLHGDEHTYQVDKAGLWIAYRCTHPEADEKTQPFTLDLIMLAWTRYLDVKNKAEDCVLSCSLIAMHVDGVRMFVA